MSTPSGTPRSRPFPGVAVLVLGGALLVGCGESAERAALRVYEARVEDLVAEDGRVGARLDELRKDVMARNAGGDEFPAYARETAAPFYRKFQSDVEAMEVTAERLRGIHRKLQDYLTARREYLGATLAILEAGDDGALRELAARETAFFAARDGMQAAAGSGLTDTDVLDGLQVVDLFQREPLIMFLQDKRTREQVENDVRSQVLPRLKRVADRTRGSRESEGLQGAIARWADTGVAYAEALLAWIPGHDRMRTVFRTAEARWEDAIEARKGFLDGLRAYRESLR